MQPAITISPKTATLAKNATQQFTCNTPSVTYRVLPNADAGSVNAAGLYTSGGTAGTFTVEVKASDGTVDTATVTVT